jgi:hypothetical protein
MKQNLKNNGNFRKKIRESLKNRDNPGKKRADGQPRIRCLQDAVHVIFTFCRYNVNVAVP